MYIIKCTSNYAEQDNIGGKGLSLCKLYKEGFKVPRFFIITTDVYDKYVRNDDLDSILNDVYSLFDEYKFDKVSIRSSANIEDGSEKSWAGQFDTFLNVTKKDLKESIIKCFNSAKSSNIEIYNEKQETIRVAVIVQEMINSDLSGVAFSSNPITQEEETIIEAVKGLGEKIVSGKVTPDRFVIKNGKINKNQYSNIKISNKRIFEIQQNILKIKKIYGFPVDIEWAIKDDILYILQARPITTIDIQLNDLLNRLNEKKWNYYVTRDIAYFVWYVYDVIAKQKDLQQKVFDIYAPLENTLLLNTDEYILDDEHNLYNSILEERFDEDEDFFEVFYNKHFEVCDEVIEAINRIKEIDFDSLSVESVKQEFFRFLETYIKICIIGNIRPDDYLEEKVKNIMSEKLNNKNVDTSFKIISLCPYIRKADYSEEPLDLLKIAKNIEGGIDEEKKNSLIFKHCEKYSWMKGPMEKKELSFTIEDYKSRVENLIKMENIDERIKYFESIKQKNEEEFKTELDKYSFTRKEIKLINAMRVFIFLRAYTSGLSDHLLYLARKTIFKNLAEHLNISSEDIAMMSPNEIENAFTSKITNYKEIIDNRKKGYAIVTLNGITKEFTGKQALILQKNIAKTFKVNEVEANVDNTNIIYGVSANYGVVTGIVKVLIDYSDIQKVENGDIIVATTTAPNFIEAMEKASGFITDEGGITCHAAIVSREFNLPCIVGTKNATEKLKDGMTVCLDGNNGIVKIIDSKE